MGCPQAQHLPAFSHARARQPSQLSLISLAFLSRVRKYGRLAGQLFRVPLAARPLLSISAFRAKFGLTRHLVIGSQGRWPFPGGDVASSQPFLAGSVGAVPSWPPSQTGRIDQRTLDIQSVRPLVTVTPAALPKSKARAPKDRRRPLWRPCGLANSGLPNQRSGYQKPRICLPIGNRRQVW